MRPDRMPPPLSSSPAPQSWPGVEYLGERLGYPALLVFAALAFLGTAPATLALVVLTLAFVACRDHWRALAADPVARAALAFGLYVGIQTLVQVAVADPPARAVLLATGADWLKLLLFIPVAHWIDGRPERARRVLLLALLGFVAGTLRHIDWAGLDARFFATRFESHLPAIAFGMFTGLGVLGLLATREAWWRAGVGTWRQWPVIGAWALLLTVLLEGLILSQSRGSWLAFLAALALLGALEWRARPQDVSAGTPVSWRRRLPPLLAGLALLAVLGLQAPLLGERLAAQTGTVSQLLRGETQEIIADPVGARVHALRFAWERWRERPWFGWGAGTSRAAIAASGRASLFDVARQQWLPHLHNSYAETLVQLGAVGLLLAALLVGTLTRAARRGRLPADLARLLAATLVFVLIWNLFNYRVVRTDWIFFWILAAGTALGLARSASDPTPRPGDA